MLSGAVALVAISVKQPGERPRALGLLLFLGAIASLALVLSVCTSIAGGLFEAYIHWRAGLGWHGLHCVIGPVHRDLLPFEAGLSFVAAALLAAGEHVAAWMRRTFALLRAVPPRACVHVPAAPVHVLDVPRTILCPSAGTPRAPPALS